MDLEAAAAAPPPAEQTDAAALPKPHPKDEPEGILPLREMIEAKLVELFEGYLCDDHGSYLIGLESARVFVVPTWLDDDKTVVRVFAITNLDVPVTAELTSFLVSKNLEFVIGAFALDVEHGAVWFNHNLMGNYTQPEELEATIAAVAETAAHLDDEIKSRFGGRLYVETPEQSIPTPDTPGYL